MIAAQSHPDLMVLERWSEANPSRKTIPVDEARKLPEFFSKAPAIGDYRVAIIDSADDLNVNAANAVLKTLEEPSGRGVLLLVSHAPGRLLPTIRSRCRRLTFRPWPEGRLADLIMETLNLPPTEALRLAAMSCGAPGRSLSLAAQGALEVDQQIGQFLSSLPNTDSPNLLNLVDSFRGGEGAVRFHLVLERLTSRLHAASSNLASSGAGVGAERWSMAWTRAMALSSRVEDLNMDRTDAFWSLVADLKRVAQSDPFPC
jgi:DNA polymerase-3 subunit delta'